MNQIKKIDVLGLGSVSVDFVGIIERWPEEGTKSLLKDFIIHILIGRFLSDCYVEYILFIYTHFNSYIYV